MVMRKRVYAIIQSHDWKWDGFEAYDLAGADMKYNSLEWYNKHVFGEWMARVPLRARRCES